MAAQLIAEVETPEDIERLHIDNKSARTASNSPAAKSEYY